MATTVNHPSIQDDEEPPVEVELQGFDSDIMTFSVTTSKRKDISIEARSKKDIKKFASSSDATILLQCLGENEGQILIYLTDELIRQGKIPESLRSTFMDAMLTDEKVPKFKNVVRGKEDGSWLVPVGEIPELTERTIAFVQLRSPVNFGGQVVQLLFFAFTPPGVAPLKGPAETGKTFASLLQNPQLRYALTSKSRAKDIQRELMRYLYRAKSLKSDEVLLSVPSYPSGLDELEPPEKETEPATTGLEFNKIPFLGIAGDVKRRIPWYVSDYLDGVNGLRTIGKSLSTIAFLYFACILPAIAFGVLNEDQTEGHIDVKKMIWSQAIGGAAFAIFSGQPLVVLLSTAPLALYMKVIFAIAGNSGMDFYALYGWVGVSNGVFLALYAITNASGLLKYVSRFTEETFGVFISIAFAYDALRPMAESFIHNYYDCSDSEDGYSDPCNREESLQFLILLFGTVLFGWWFWSLKSSVLLTRTLREKISDYSLPLAVGVMTILGSGILRPTNDEQFPYTPQPSFILVPMLDVPLWGAGVGIGLGFILSVLYFMDQNISSKMVNTPNHHLRKGPAYHLDLLVMAFITIGLSLAGLPWIHGALPHSPLHVRALADLESVYLPGGTVEERVVSVRESRVPALIAHILIGLSVYMVPTPLQEIPVPVLYGVFLYLSVTALPGNQFWQRILLFITDRNRYPPNHVVRHAPSRVIHVFTVIQILCLLWLCVFGFTPVDYIQMLLPLAIIVLIPVRKFILGRLFSPRNLLALDGE